MDVDPPVKVATFPHPKVESCFMCSDDTEHGTVAVLLGFFFFFCFLVFFC